MSNVKTQYRVLLDTGTKLIGSFYHDDTDDLKIKLSATTNDLTTSLDIRTTLAAPHDWNLRDNVHVVVTRLFSHNIMDVKLERVQVTNEQSHITDTTSNENNDNQQADLAGWDMTPDSMSNRFERLASATEGIAAFESLPTYAQGKKVKNFVEGDNGSVLLRLTITAILAESTHEGLYRTLNFQGFKDDLGQPVDKSHLNRYFHQLSQLFPVEKTTAKYGSNEDPTTLVIYVRDERNSPMENFMHELYEAMHATEANGPGYRQIYPKKARPMSNAIPHFQYNATAKEESERPRCDYRHTFIFQNPTELTTRYALAVLETLEDNQRIGNEFQDLTHEIKCLEVPGVAEEFIIAVLEMPVNSEKRLSEDDRLRVDFNTSQQIRDSESAPWDGVVIKPLEWMVGGEVAIYLTRPRKPYPPGATQSEKKKERPFVTDKIPAIKLEGCNSMDAIRAIIDAQRPLRVKIFTNESILTERRQLNAIGMIQLGVRRHPNNPEAPAIRSPLLEFWGEVMCNRNGIPDCTTSLYVDLPHLTDDDHVRATLYVNNLPTFKPNPTSEVSISIGVIEGYPGTGKSTYIAAVLIFVWLTKRHSIAVLCSGNGAVDVMTEKLVQEAAKHPTCNGIVIVRGHSAETEKGFTFSYGRNEAKKAKHDAEMEREKTMSPEEKANALRHSEAVRIKHREEACAAQAARQAQIAEVDAKLAENNREIDTQEIQEIFDSDSDSGSGDTTEALPTPAPLNIQVPADVEDIFALLERDNNNAQFLRKDGSLDMTKIQNSEILKHSRVAYEIFQHCEKHKATAERLTLDPRFKRIRESLGYLCLVVTGFVPEQNRLTAPEKWGAFVSLFSQFMEIGESMDSHSHELLNAALTELKNHIVAEADIILLTANTLASGIYSSFRPKEGIAVVDEANQMNVADFMIIVAHLEPTIVLFIGDENQLGPTVSIPHGIKVAFRHQLQVSALKFFKASGIPCATLDWNRRAVKGLQDIPFRKYYHVEVQNHPSSEDIEEHPYASTHIRVLNKYLTSKKSLSGPACYLEVSRSNTQTDPATSSKFNLDMAACGVNVIEKYITEGVPASNISIVTPYRAQKNVYAYAFGRLHEEQPDVGWKGISIDTANSAEGSQNNIIVLDSVVTDKPGFTDDMGQINVALTRSRDGIIVIGDTKQAARSQNRKVPEIVQVFEMAKDKVLRLVRGIPTESKLRVHRFVMARVRRGLLEGDEASDDDAQAVAEEQAAATDQSAPEPSAEWGASESQGWNEPLPAATTDQSAPEPSAEWGASEPQGWDEPLPAIIVVPRTRAIDAVLVDVPFSPGQETPIMIYDNTVSVNADSTNDQPDEIRADYGVDAGEVNFEHEEGWGEDRYD